ncbi:MAG TPA: hypothetical protein VKR06_00025 [Ktedonosporobacter sp.]|nr:hypothetical protein [Ktedonosporobacter sp.]
MAIFSVTDCCSMLGIDVKTLRQWLKRSQMQFVAHPVDARRKCLSEEQVRQLATLHNRPVPFPDRANPAPVPELAHGTPSGLPASTSEVDLVQKLAALQAKVTTMHEQLTQLALQVLQERNAHYEQRLSTLEALLAQQLQVTLALPGYANRNTIELPPAQQNVGRRLHPAEQHARSRVLPLIEYGAQGQYLAVCPKEGVLPLQVDSTAWFDWLATLVSFRFVGPVGHFTAYRNTNHGRRNRTWIAHRHVHGRTYKTVLGVTDHLTISCLEQAAAELHAHLTAQ